MKIISKFKIKGKKGFNYVMQSENGKQLELTYLIEGKKDILYVPTEYTDCTIITDLFELMQACRLSLCINDRNDDYLDKRISNNTQLIAIFISKTDPLLNYQIICELCKSLELKALGYFTVDYQLISPLSCNLSKINISDTKEPLKVIYHMHTSDWYNIDYKLSELILYREYLLSFKELVKKYELHKVKKNPIGIEYSLVRGVNDSEYHNANLIYYLERYNIPINFIIPKSDEEINQKTSYLINDIHEYAPKVRVTSKTSFEKNLCYSHK